MAQQHPPFPHRPPNDQYIEHIWAYMVLKTDAALSRLQRLGSSTHRRHGNAAQETAKAIFIACASLAEELDEAVMKAQKGGELLFCWHGTLATAIGRERAA